MLFDCQVILHCVCVCVCVCMYIYIYIYIYIHHIFMHSSIDGHLGSFHTLATVDSAAINMGGVHVSLQNAHLYPLDKCLVVQLLGSRVVLFLV